MDYTLKNYENVNYVMCMFLQWKKKGITTQGLILENFRLP